ncbi:beta-Ala-His dipeptidase [Candidatus Fermentibacteria bacterium]|nr:beta-Ala-His dipeptidase [Candidatus Fermentibacteria bacterium]
MNLQPSSVWEHFESLSRIPRCSGNESRVGDFVVETARELGLESRRDACGNVVVRKQASEGVSAPPIVLQAHLDMVCEKLPRHGHDFGTDPIVPLTDGDWVRAQGTTLGADNGIGLAMALAILESTSLRHPPLELLATVEEEVGLKGAAALSDDFVHGRSLINLDAEDENEILVGCAGGVEITAQRDIACLPDMMLDGIPVRVVMEGLRGGHSGIDIHTGRGNAVSLLAASLIDLAGTHPELLVAELVGGTKSNAIPRDAHAVVLVRDRADLDAWADGRTAWWRKALQSRDDGIAVRIEPADRGTLVFSSASTHRLLQFVAGFPHGVWAVDPDLGNMVETSANLAVVEALRGNLRVLVSLRSSVPHALEHAAARVEALTRLIGLEPTRTNEYPPWPRAADSPLLSAASETFARVHGKTPVIATVHAGLECGILSQKLPGLDAISIGPTIVNPHSPDERVHIGSVQRSFAFLVALLARLSL